MKRGQVSPFLIMGLVLVVLAAVVVLVVSVTTEKKAAEQAAGAAELAAEAQEIETFITLCVRRTAYEGLELLGRQGGYLAVPRLIRLQGTASWHLDQVNIQPALNQTLQRLETHINNNLESCTALERFRAQGFDISAQSPKSAVFYTPDSVSIDVRYPVQVRKEGYEKSFEQFHANLDVRFRRMFELASQIVNRQLDPAFRFSAPLELVDAGDFAVSYQRVDNETLLYTITDPTRLEEGQRFSFTFASRFRPSGLKRSVALQRNSHIVATVLPLIVYSLDRMAQLNIFPGATMALDNDKVEAITVQQFYPDNATRSDVPFHELADNSVTYGDLTWVLTYPVYRFEPTGMRFSSPQRLVLYWDNDRVPAKGKMGILYREGSGEAAGAWRPLPARADYGQHFVYTDIPGFSEFTPVDCEEQPEKDTSATAEIDPGGKCWAIFIVAVIVIIILLYLIGPFIVFLKGAIGALFTAVVVTSVAVVGGAFTSSQLAYSAGEDSVTFTPTCDQQLEIREELSNGQGMCVPSGTVDVTGGTPQPIQAQLQKCTGARKYFCGKCSLTCSTKYK